jgi:hypothetical protein
MDPRPKCLLCNVRSSESWWQEVFFAMPSTVLSLDIPWQFASNHGISSKLPYSDMNSPPISWSWSGFMIYSSNSTDIKPSHPQSISQSLMALDCKGPSAERRTLRMLWAFLGTPNMTQKKRKNGWFSTKKTGRHIGTAPIYIDMF